MRKKKRGSGEKEGVAPMIQRGTRRIDFIGDDSYERLACADNTARRSRERIPFSLFYRAHSCVNGVGGFFHGDNTVPPVQEGRNNRFCETRACSKCASFAHAIRYTCFMASDADLRSSSRLGARERAVSRRGEFRGESLSAEALRVSTRRLLIRETV